MLNIVKNKYVFLLINYIKMFYSNSEDKNEFIQKYFNLLKNNENSPIVFYYLSYILNKTEIIIEVNDEFIEYLKNIFETNNSKDNDNNNNKILSISSFILLSGYYMINQKEDSEKLKEFKQFLNNLNIGIKIIDDLMKVLNINLKDSNDNICKILEDIINENITINFENLNANQEQYIDFFFKFMLSVIEESPEINNFFNILNKENINYFYKTFKSIYFNILKSKNIKLFQNLLSSENYVYSKIIYYKLICSNNEDKMSVEEDIIQCCKELILFHNSPFIFKLIEIINENINDNNDDNKENQEILTEKAKCNLIDININIIKTIFELLKNNNIDFKNKKQSKYYIRGLIYLLIIIHNTFESKNKLYCENKQYINIFIELVKLIDKINIIYSNYCIKIDDSRGKLISELIFDSIMNLLMVNNDKDIKELFTQIFIKKNKNNDITIFYLIDLITISNLDKEIKNQLKNYFKDIPKIKQIDNLIKTKIIYKLKEKNSRKYLANYKCVEPIIDVNFCIYFIGKTSILLSCKTNKIGDDEFTNYLENKFINILNEDIIKFKTSCKNNYHEDIFKNIKFYSIIKDLYNNNHYMDPNNFNSLKKILLDDLPKTLKFQCDLKLYYSSIFIWNESNSEQINNDKTLNNKIDNKESYDIIKDNELINNEDKSNKINDINNKEENKIEENVIILNENEKDLQKDKKDEKNINKEIYNDYNILDNIKNKCFILSPKNMLIKRIFPHIYYNLLFHDDTFMYIKNYFLRTFKTANVNTKQLNYPSKIKNFSNIYEPKLFLRKDFNYYDETYFKICYDFLFYKDTESIILDESKENKIKSLINSKLSLVNFYEHDFNVNDIIQEKDRYFDCELITAQYVYYGFIIFGKDYIYFQSKKEFPFIYDKSNKNLEDFDINLFLKYGFTVRNKDNITNKNKRLILFYNDINHIMRRRILLMYQSIEIFCLNGKSYFFNLFQRTKCDEVFKILNEIRDNLDNKDKFNLINNNIKEEMKNINSKLKNRKINNYLYLSKINYYSSRTFNDISQYPIFPWIILDFNKVKNLLKEAKDDKGRIEYIDNELKNNINE